jgi:hypothetical protein
MRPPLVQFLRLARSLLLARTFILTSPACGRSVSVTDWRAPERPRFSTVYKPVKTYYIVANLMPSRKGCASLARARQPIGGQYYDQASYLTYVMIGEEDMLNCWTSIRNGREFWLPGLVINVITNPSARWRHRNIQTAITSLFVIGSRWFLYPRDRSD